MILYFTGTGNSRWVAQQLAEATNDTIINIADCLKQEVLPEDLINEEKVGIVFPVHAWYVPRVIIGFLSNLPVSSLPISLCDMYVW